MFAKRFGVMFNSTVALCSMHMWVCKDITEKESSSHRYLPVSDMWIIFALIAAVSAAVSRTIMKSAGQKADVPAIVFARYIFAAVPAAVMIAIVGIPEIEAGFWSALLIACLVDLGAVIFMTKSLQKTSIALSVPLLSFTPGFVLVVAFVVLDEQPTWIGLAGVLTIVVGAYWLNVREKQTSILGPFRRLAADSGARYMLGTALLFAFAGVYFKKAILHSSPYFSMAVSLPIDASMTVVYYSMLRREKKQRLLPDHSNWSTLVSLGLVVFVVSLSVNLAFEIGLASYVVAIKRLSILLNLVLGAIVFKEKDLARNLLAAAVMVAGAALVAIG